MYIFSKKYVTHKIATAFKIRIIVMCDELQIYKFCFHQFVLPVFAMIFLTAQKREKKIHRSMTDYPETHRKSPETGRGGFRRFLLKYGFCKKLLLSECNSDQLNIS